MIKEGAKKRVIGVTGGLATGKTTVACLFSEKGAIKIDADAIGHQILKEDNNIKKRIVNLFGEKILTDANIDRVKLRQEVFLDAERLRKLNDIMHPAIIERVREKINCFEEGTLLIDAPLLIETGLQEDVDVLIVVTASYETQVKRVHERGLTEEEARKIINSQMPISEKLQFADYVIDNDGDLNKTKEGVEELWHKMKNL